MILSRTNCFEPFPPAIDFFWKGIRLFVYSGAEISRTVVLVVALLLAAVSTSAAAREFRAADTQNEDYPTVQALRYMGRLVEEKGGDTGVHLIGHSLGGTIARRYAADAPKGTVRMLITLGSPYSYGQRSPREIGIFGDDDPIVPAPIEDMLHPAAFARIVVLHDVGHLALIFHPEVLRIIGTELRANRASETQHAAT